MSGRHPKQRPKRRHGGRGPNWIAIGGAALGIVMALAWMLSAPRTDAPFELQAIAPVERPPTAQGGVTHPVISKEVAWVMRALEGSGERAGFEMVFRPRIEVCREGDLDAIKGDLDLSEVKRVILTIEELVPSDGQVPLYSKPVHFSLLERGGNLRVDLPRPAAPRQLGLFICKDSSNTGRCNDKKVMRIDEILMEHQRYGKKEAGVLVDDRVYFFQYFFVDGNGSFATFQNAPVAKETFANLSEKLAQYFPVERLEAERQVLQQAQNTIRKVDSLPLLTEKQGVAALLPGTGGKKCTFSMGPNGWPTSFRPSSE